MTRYFDSHFDNYLDSQREDRQSGSRGGDSAEGVGSVGGVGTVGAAASAIAGYRRQAVRQDPRLSLERRPYRGERLPGEEPVWELVRRVRKQRGLTQYQLADMLAELSRNASVSRDEVARWERGKRVPGPYWRRWLSAALGVPLDELTAAVRCGRRIR